jgi:hypothetical protein
MSIDTMSADDQADFRSNVRHYAVMNIQTALTESGICSNSSTAHDRAKDIYDGQDPHLYLDDQTGSDGAVVATKFTEVFEICDTATKTIAAYVRLRSYDGKPRP